MASNFVDSQSQSQNNHTIETSSETLAHPGCSDRTQKQEISTHSDHQDCADDANGRSISEIPATNLVSNDQNLEKKGNEHVENAATSLKQVILKPLLSEPNTQSGTDKDCSGGEEETTSRRRRKSRWDSDGASSDGTGTGTRKRKSRWADDPKPVIQLPDFMNFTAGIEFDPEIQVLNSRLLEISRKFQSGLPLDDRPEGARSPSPEPVYDNMGIRINTREFRARERLTRERQEIISQIIKKNPAFKPPADYRPPKLHKKLYIPMKEYPGYNFIGLIIGPRGNTQKRMEKESGAKIVIRGKGSVKEGRLLQKRDLKHDPSENEDLHVLVEADTHEALDAAAGMVEKLLQPVDEVLNEHKRQQLKELAALNGTTRDEEYCKLCGESGHRQYACPSRTSTFRSDVLCKICGDGGHPTIDCPVKGTTGNKMDEEYRNFLAELGGTVPESSTKQNGATLALGPGSCGSNSSLGSDNSTSVTVGISQAGLGTLGTKLIKENDETNLYIGYLPPSLDDDGLISLFSPFGVIVMAKVIKDRVTGLSKGYGFVKYSDVQQATSAIASMNGYQLDGRSIAVRVAGKPPPPAMPPAPPVGPTPTIGMNQVGGVYPTQQFSPTTPIGIAPPVIPVNCAGTPVPWAPAAPVVPVAPTPYAPYPPPPPPPPLPLPPGSAMYTTVLPGQPIVPYGVQCPPSTNAAATGIATQTPAVGETPYASSTEIQQTLPPGVQSQISASVHPVPTYIQGHPITAVPPTAQPAYPAPSSVCPPYYGAVPPPPLPTTTVDPLSIVDQSLSLGNVPWASKPPVPMSSAEKTNPSVDAKCESKGGMK